MLENATLPVRFTDIYGHCIKLDIRIPVPEKYTIDMFDGTVVMYQRRFALIRCGEEPKIVEVFFYENDRRRVG